MDKSERKVRQQADEALARSLQFVEQVFQQTEAGLFLFNADDYFVRVNPAFARMFGYEPHEMEGKHGSLILSPEDIELNARRLEALKQGETPEPREFSPIAKDGSRRYVRSSPTRVLDVDGEQLFLGTVIDITERKRAEDRLRESEERYRKLAEENARLYQAERERSKQLSFAIQETHHRVKNSLQTVSAILEMHLISNEDEWAAEVIRETMEQIKVIAVVHDFLSVDQPVGKVDAAQVIQKLAQMLFAGRNLGLYTIALSLDTEPIWLPTKVATGLALVVNELLTNSIKHGCAFNKKPSQRPETIKLRMHKKDGNVFLSIQDDGPGFPPDFDPRSHAHLGLEIVCTLVQYDLQGTVHFLNGSDRSGEGKRGGYVEIVFSEHAPSE